MKWYNNLFVDRFNEMIGLILDSWQRFLEKLARRCALENEMKRPPLLNNENLSGKHEEVTWPFSFERTCTQYAIVPIWCRWFYRTHTHKYTHFRKTREQFEWNSKLWMRIIRIAWWICRCCHCNTDKNHLLNGRKKCTAEVWRVQFLMGELAQDHA